MADQPAAEKTEQPTPRKLKKAKDKGQVPQSQELSSIATLIVLIAMIALSGPSLCDWFKKQMELGFSCDNSVFTNTQTFVQFFSTRIFDVIILISPILAALMVGAIAAGAVISGINFSPKAVELKFSQLNPIEGFSKLVNMQSFVKLLVSILKLIFVSVIVWFYIKDKLDTFASLRWANSDQILSITAKIILGLVIRIAIALLIISLSESLFQKWKFMQDLKMTRQEVKDDHKETEGSPDIKRRIRSIQFQAAFKRMLQDVPKATVVLVNPTHYAVAIRYDPKTMEAPILVAKGADHMAEKIREVARAYGVPIISKPELTRTIYAAVEPGKQIPEDLYVAVAQVLAMIYRLRNKKKQSSK
ncbi:MAG: flagellar biosynthesis protein FlhB [Sedimentisphaerales bacterium]|nr:flagellar biosynthesis protein FlhB [Sedimentisphaerales bacterium]